MGLFFLGSIVVGILISKVIFVAYLLINSAGPRKPRNFVSVRQHEAPLHGVLATEHPPVSAK